MRHNYICHAIKVSPSWLLLIKDMNDTSVIKCIIIHQYTTINQDKHAGIYSYILNSPRYLPAEMACISQLYINCHDHNQHLLIFKSSIPWYHQFIRKWHTRLTIILVWSFDPVLQIRAFDAWRCDEKRHEPEINFGITGEGWREQFWGTYSVDCTVRVVSTVQ